MTTPKIIQNVLPLALLCGLFAGLWSVLMWKRNKPHELVHRGK